MESERNIKSLEKIGFLIAIKDNFDEFYNSWWINKCSEYDANKLSDYYDIFFSRYVVFNSLYNTFFYAAQRIKVLEGQMIKKERKDERSKAINFVLNKLIDLDFHAFFEDSNINKEIFKLVNHISEEDIVISHKNGEQDKDSDLLILDKLSSFDNRQKFLGVLEIIYNVRNSMFHGSKSFRESQKKLLGPVNYLLFHVVTILYRKFEEYVNITFEDTEETGPI